jgi:hypothetical protein
MRRLLAAAGVCFTWQVSLAAGNITYLSCPAVDKRADDLVVVLDQQNGTASLQSDKSGSGLNFTSPASFGPKYVSWQNQSKSFPQKFTVDRVSLILKRETTSRMSGSVYLETSACSIIKAPADTKF